METDGSAQLDCDSSYPVTALIAKKATGSFLWRIKKQWRYFPVRHQRKMLLLRHPSLDGELTRIRKVGKGLQYTVYDLGNGRIFKRPATFLECYCRMCVWKFPFWKTSIREIFGDVKRTQLDAKVSINKLLPLLPRISPELGNPLINDDNSYEQDRAIVVERYLHDHTLEENKQIIDQYVALLFRFWEHGFNDRPFKFLLNYGVTDAGRLILLDLGELYFEKDKAQARIHARLWEQISISEPVLDNYYRTTMRAAMTAENLERYWQKALL